MPLFYFDLYDGDRAVSDLFGVEVESVEQAAALLPDIARDVLPAQGSRDFATFVRDQDGTLVHRAALPYRAQSLSSAGDLVSDRDRALDIILQLQNARDRARQLSARLEANVSDLLDLIRQSAQVIQDAKAASADRISAQLR